jgi:hypothetical protein
MVDAARLACSALTQQGTAGVSTIRDDVQLLLTQHIPTFSVQALQVFTGCKLYQLMIASCQQDTLKQSYA